MQKIKHPQIKPTKAEQQKLDSSFHLPGWHFEKVILPDCILISREFISNSRVGFEYATLYGLTGINTESRQRVIANFFLRYKSRLYQFNHIKDAIEMIELIKKEKRWEDYEELMWEAKRVERQKRMALKKEERLLLKEIA